jgi:hypothetical protein
MKYVHEDMRWDTQRSKFHAQVTGKQRHLKTDHAIRSRMGFVELGRC